MASISYPEEAAGSFQNAVIHLRGYTVAITLDEKDNPDPFDAEIIGPDFDADNYYAVRFRLLDEESGEAVGDTLSGVVKNISICRGFVKEEPWWC